MDEAGPSTEFDSDHSGEETIDNLSDYSSEESEVNLTDVEDSSDDSTDEDVDLDPGPNLNPWVRVYPPEENENTTHNFHEATGPDYAPATNAKPMDYFLLF